MSHLISSSTASSLHHINNTMCAANCTNVIETYEVLWFTEEQRRMLYITTITAASLSILGTSLITLSYILYPSLRTFPYKLIVLLSLSDLANSISYLLPIGDITPTHGPHNELIRAHATPMCIAQAALSQFFSLATFCWVLIFSWNIYEVLVRKRSNVEKYEKYYHIVAWGIPSFLLALNFIFDSFGPTLVWCWIDSNHNALRIITFYAPLLLIFTFNFIFYVIIGRSLRHSMDDEKQNAINSRLRQYLLVFVFVRIWSLLNRFQNIIQPNEPVFFLYFMHSLCSPLQGAANSVVYGLNVRVRAHYSAILCSCFGGATKDQPDNPNYLQQSQYDDSTSQLHHPTHYHPDHFAQASVSSSPISVSPLGETSFDETPIQSMIYHAHPHGNSRHSRTNSPLRYHTMDDQ